MPFFLEPQPVLLAPSRAVLLGSVVRNPSRLEGICRGCVLLAGNRLGSEFDRSIFCSRMTIIPAESEMCSQLNVNFLLRTAQVLVDFSPARLFIVKCLLL